MPTIWQAFICPLTPSSIAQGERCAPAAFLRSVSNLSGPLSRIEPLSSVPVVTIACPLRCHLVDRSEAHCKSHPEAPSRSPGQPFVWWSERAPIPSLFCAVLHAPRPSSCPVRQGVRSCISLRITRVIHIAHQALRPDKRACYSLQLFCGAVRRFREKALLFGGMHGLVFRRSIHYWQDQPGIPRSTDQRGPKGRSDPPNGS